MSQNVQFVIATMSESVKLSHDQYQTRTLWNCQWSEL